ncbi:lytic polysaccharide monooxygenase [Mycobacterium szulgai]|uniref:Cellulose-binding protein n=1 Tax=Mycobacterium szulgai TaxID=1787 RepID=A0A1X2DK14_MYCSZ|nr:lytic polysaccharide monooxygenase [Mycobacterium szulgai]MCV7077378.1 lytic polysaccharide monooxygenase [Mycobacterium szulgai]ORW88380.1 cellulose-binding protein [Mycobacterium szulgai]
MKNRLISVIAATALVPSLPVVLPTAAAHAHGYIATPASRQAQCAQGLVQCGSIKYEPQSVEGPKGLRSCSGGLPQFAELDDDSKPWQPTSVAKTATFTWKNTAQHRTTGWEYYVGATRVASFDGNNAPPDATVTHTVDLSQFSGRQKLLAIWNIGDTPNAFYNCVDLIVGGGQAPTSTTPTSTTPPTSTPPTSVTTPATTMPPGTAKAWAPGTKYAAGDTVTYNGKTYTCLQSHTAYDPTWTPAATPALWKEA